MASPVLFSTGAAPTGTQSRNLVEFKAGKMEMRDKMVHPIKRKGMIFLRQSPDDNLMHFCWRDRQTGIVEDDLILFPDDCEFKRVKECTTGRVYVLKMRSSDKKMFFWMQESKTDRDDEFCKKINEMLNNPPRGGSDINVSSDRDLQALLGNMTQEQVAHLLSQNGVNLASLLNSAPGHSPSSNSGNASTTNSSAPVSDDAEALMAERGSGSQAREAQPLVDLSTAINSDSLAHLLEDDEFLRLVEPHLPPVGPNRTNQPSNPEERKKQFSQTIHSSQFRSSLSQFCVALQSGQLGPLMSQFGLSQACVDAANLGDLEAFVRALDALNETKNSTSTDHE